jgi:hypothetical protein
MLKQLLINFCNSFADIMISLYYFLSLKWFAFHLEWGCKISAIWHKIVHPTHKIIWKYKPDEECDGDIVCDTCDRLFWCRAIEESLKGDINEYYKKK